MTYLKPGVFQGLYSSETLLRVSIKQPLHKINCFARYPKLLEA